jgi:hypothetical protein
VIDHLQQMELEQLRRNLSDSEMKSKRTVHDVRMRPLHLPSWLAHRVV